MRGRKPKPLALKIATDHQKSRTNFDEPVIPSGSIVAPPELHGSALDHWNELAPILSDAGMLTAGDRMGLTQLCRVYQTLRSKPTDQKARLIYIRLLTEFGLTPSSRSRIKSTVEKPKDALGEFLSKRKAT